MRAILVSPIALLMTLLLFVLMMQLVHLKPMPVMTKIVELSAVAEESFQSEPEAQQEAPAIEEPLQPEVTEPPAEPEAIVEPNLLIEPILDLEMEPLEPELSSSEAPLDIDLPDMDLAAIPIAKEERKKVEKKVKKVKKVVKKKVTQTKRVATKAKQPTSAKPVAAKPAKATTKNQSLGFDAKPLRKVKPSYPRRARRRGVEGVVVVGFTVKANGEVDRRSLRVISAKPKAVFDKVVLKAVAKWRFATAAQPYKVKQQLVFKLDKK